MSATASIVITQRRTLRIAAELTAIFVLLVAIDKLFAARNGFAHFQPSPYWLPVLIMAISYGTWPGLAAAALATAAWLSMHDISPAGRDYFAYIFDISLPPLLWYSAAVVIGEVTNRRPQDRSAEGAAADRQRQHGSPDCVIPRAGTKQSRAAIAHRP